MERVLEMRNLTEPDGAPTCSKPGVSEAPTRTPDWPFSMGAWPLSPRDWICRRTCD